VHRHFYSQPKTIKADGFLSVLGYDDCFRFRLFSFYSFYYVCVVDYQSPPSRYCSFFPLFFFGEVEGDGDDDAATRELLDRKRAQKKKHTADRTSERRRRRRCVFVTIVLNARPIYTQGSRLSFYDRSTRKCVRAGKKGGTDERWEMAREKERSNTHKRKCGGK
jgi:hypothetical protein